MKQLALTPPQAGSPQAFHIHAVGRLIEEQEATGSLAQELDTECVRAPLNDQWTLRNKHMLGAAQFRLLPAKPLRDGFGQSVPLPLGLRPVECEPMRNARRRPSNALFRPQLQDAVAAVFDRGFHGVVALLETRQEPCVEKRLRQMRAKQREHQPVTVGKVAVAPVDGHGDEERRTDGQGDAELCFGSEVGEVVIVQRRPFKQAERHHVGPPDGLFGPCLPDVLGRGMLSAIGFEHRQHGS